MTLGLASPIAAAALVAPSLAFAALSLLGDAPGEWGRSALIAWTAAAASLLAGAALQAGAGPLVWAVPLLCFAAVMTGGPPGLAVAAVAAALLGLAAGLPAPRWLPLALAALAALAAIRAATA